MTKQKSNIFVFSYFVSFFILKISKGILLKFCKWNHVFFQYFFLRWLSLFLGIKLFPSCALKMLLEFLQMTLCFFL